MTALGSTYDVKTDGAQVAGAFSLMEEEFRGETTPLHTHPDAEETFSVLEGRVELWPTGEPRRRQRARSSSSPEASRAPRVADPERLAALAAEYGTHILGDCPEPQ